MFALYLLLWWFVGIAGFVFWFTKDNDFGTQHLAIAAAIGLGGPLNWAIGWFIHGDPLPNRNRIIFRQRK